MNTSNATDRVRKTQTHFGSLIRQALVSKIRNEKGDFAASVASDKLRHGMTKLPCEYAGIPVGIRKI